MKPETEKILQQVKKNFDLTPDKVAKQDLHSIVEALVEFFVDEEPRLVDPNVDEELKGAMFFKALMKGALNGGEAWAQKNFISENEWEEKLPFLKKIKKFMRLEETLIRYSKNVV